MINDEIKYLAKAYSLVQKQALGVIRDKIKFHYFYCSATEHVKWDVTFP